MGRAFQAEDSAGAKAGEKEGTSVGWRLGRKGDSCHMTEGSVHQVKTY